NNVDSAIVSVVGDDSPQEYLDLLSSKNIDISGIEIVKGGKTFFWSGLYHNDLNSRDTLDTQLHVLADSNPVVRQNFQDAEVIMLGSLQPNIQISVLDQLTAQPRLVVLDTMNFSMDCGLEGLKQVLKRIDVLTVSDEEARQLSGEYS